MALLSNTYAEGGDAPTPLASTSADGRVGHLCMSYAQSDASTTFFFLLVQFADTEVTLDCVNVDGA